MPSERYKACIALGQMLLREPVSWILLAALVYVFLALNVDFAPGLTWHDGQRLAELALLAFMVFALGVPEIRVSAAGMWMALPHRIRMMLFAVIALGLMSAVHAMLWRWALLEWATLLLLLVLTLGIAAGRRACGKRLDMLLIAGLYAAAAAYVAKVVVVYWAMLTVGAEYGQAFNVRELFPGFSNIRFFGHVQTMLLPFLFLPLVWCRSFRYRLLFGLVPLVWWMLVVASGTRGTWVALIMGMTSTLIFGGRTGHRWCKWQVAGLGGGLVLYGIFVLLVPDIFGQQAAFLHRVEDITSLSRREVIWAAAYWFGHDNPMLGVGPMHFAYYGNVVAAHPHNAILQFFSEWGIPAAVLMTAVFVAGGWAFSHHVRRAVKEYDEDKGLMAVALLAAVTGAAAQAMVDGVLVMPVSQVTLALLCGWSLGFYFAGRGDVAECGATGTISATIIIILAAGCMIYGVLPEIGDLSEREEKYLASHPPGTILLPRFWAQGWISQ